MLTVFDAANSRRDQQIPTPLPDELSLAIAYVVFQQDSDMVAAEEGFCRGTIFEDLYKPFTGKRGAVS